MVFGCSTSTKLMACCAGSSTSCTISFWTLLSQLRALDLSGLACLLAFPVTIACDCPQTVRQLLVQSIDNLFCSLLGPVLSADWTEHGSVATHVFKDSGSCLLGCARLLRGESCCGPPTASPFGHRCTVGVLAGTHRCALMPKVASRQSANPLCLLVSMSRAYTSKQVQRDFTLLFIESNCIAFERVSCSVSDDNS